MRRSTFQKVDAENASVDIMLSRDIVSQYDAIAAVAEHIDEVVSVSTLVNDESMLTVASNVGAVTNVAANIGSVVNVSASMPSITAVLTDIADVSAVADAVTSVENVAANVVKVVTVADNIGSINTVNTNAGNIAVVAGVSSDVSTVAGVAGSIPTIVSEIVPNMVEILMADNNAAIATTKANAASVSAVSAEASAEAADIAEQLAYEWANKAENIPVTGVIGTDDEYSAYHWAKKAEALAGGTIALDSLYDVTSNAAADKQVLRYDASGAAGSKWIPSTVDKSYIGLNNVDNTSDTTKVVASAGKWTTKRTIALSGDVTGSALIDGSANVTIAASIAANSVALGTDTVGNYVASVVAGDGIVVTGTVGEGWTATVAHSDTSSQASVNNSNGSVIQDVSVDGYGHITALSSTNLDTRYYTETEVQTTLPKVGFNIANVTAPSTGQLAWNQDERTLDLGLNGVTLQLGQEQLMYVRNGDGTTITNKTLCMAVGTIGNSGRIVVSKYDLSNPNLLVGMATEDILSGADGYITVFGKVRAIDTSMWVDGQILYAAANGGLTATEPTTGIKQPVAFVVHAHTSGALFVRMTNLDENKYLVQANGVVDCGLITEQVR